MYKCFEGIPQDVRQRAFDVLTALALKETKNEQRLGYSSHQYNRYNFQRIGLGAPGSFNEESTSPSVGSICPLGAVNVVLGVDVDKLRQSQRILAHVGIYGDSPGELGVLQFFLCVPSPGGVRTRNLVFGWVDGRYEKFREVYYAK
jgi:hypothetical protein